MWDHVCPPFGHTFGGASVAIGINFGGADSDTFEDHFGTQRQNYYELVAHRVICWAPGFGVPAPVMWVKPSE